jgi:hypothetical protein
MRSTKRSRRSPPHRQRRPPNRRLARPLVGLFAGDFQPHLNFLIGDDKQVRSSGGRFVRRPAPVRRGESIVFGPVNGLIADCRCPLAGNHPADRVPCRPVGLGRLPLGTVAGNFLLLVAVMIIFLPDLDLNGFKQPHRAGWNDITDITGNEHAVSMPPQFLGQHQRCADRPSIARDITYRDEHILAGTSIFLIVIASPLSIGAQLRQKV